MKPTAKQVREALALHKQSVEFLCRNALLIRRSQCPCGSETTTHGLAGLLDAAAGYAHMTDLLRRWTGERTPKQRRATPRPPSTRRTTQPASTVPALGADGTTTLPERGTHAAAHRARKRTSTSTRHTRPAGTGADATTTPAIPNTGNLQPTSPAAGTRQRRTK